MAEEQTTGSEGDDEIAPDTFITPEYTEFWQNFNRLLQGQPGWGEPDPPCSVCSSTNWIIAPVVEMPIDVKAMGGKGFVGKGMPFVPVICKICGHVVWFHAFLSQAITPSSDQDS
jgi:hypothetical protein